MESSQPVCNGTTPTKEIGSNCFKKQPKDFQLAQKRDSTSLLFWLTLIFSLWNTELISIFLICFESPTWITSLICCLCILSSGPWGHSYNICSQSPNLILKPCAIALSLLLLQGFATFFPSSSSPLLLLMILNKM